MKAKFIFLIIACCLLFLTGESSAQLATDYLFSPEQSEENPISNTPSEFSNDGSYPLLSGEISTLNTTSDYWGIEGEETDTPDPNVDLQSEGDIPIGDGLLPIMFLLAVYSIYQAFRFRKKIAS